MPRGIRRLINTASRLIREGHLWEAVDLSAHTVIGVRETGQWLLWFNDFHVYFESYSESKTKNMHIISGLIGYLSYYGVLVRTRDTSVTIFIVQHVASYMNCTARMHQHE